MNFQHSIEPHTSPAFHVVLHLDLVDDVALHQMLKHPAQMLGRDAEHGGAEATGVVKGDNFLPIGGEFLAHAVDQVNLRAYGKARAGRRFANDLEQALRGTNRVRLLADFHAAFGWTMT